MTRDYKELLRCLRGHSKKMGCTDTCICWDANKRGFGTCSEELAKLAADAIEELLPSAQRETAKRIVSKSRGGMTLWYQCDMCNEPVDAQDKFCRGCGRRLIDGENDE